MPDVNYDADPIRPGAAPTLSITGAGLGDLAAQQPMCVRMTDALVSWLRYHFSAVSRIEYPNLTSRVYNDNQEVTQIVIDSLAAWKPQRSGNRPAILVDRLDQEKDMAHRVIGDQFQGVKEGFFWHLMQGAHVVHCIGGREGEAEILASEVWRELVRFGPVARQALCLMRFLPVKWGKRVQLDEYKEHYSVPVVCTYTYEETWRIRPLDEAEITGIALGLTVP